MEVAEGGKLNSNKHKGTSYLAFVEIFFSTMTPTLQVKSFKEVVTHSLGRGAPSFAMINKLNSLVNPLFLE